jgi:hypothetical protein
METASGSGPDARDTDTWTSETLPMSVRRELLERELKKLGLHKGPARGGASPQASVQQQQQPQAQPAPQRPADAGDKPRGD